MRIKQLESVAKRDQTQKTRVENGTLERKGKQHDRVKACDTAGKVGNRDTVRECALAERL